MLTPMKMVVNPISTIVELRECPDVNQDMLRVLQECMEATFSNLVAASRTLATSAGM
jgi:protein SPA2